MNEKSSQGAPGARGGPPPWPLEAIFRFFSNFFKVTLQTRAPEISASVEAKRRVSHAQTRERGPQSALVEIRFYFQLYHP
jgi:hypothetical protein